MSRFGVDFSTGRPTVAALKAAGVTFVIRYTCAPPSAKVMTPDEIARYLAADLDVVTNYEGRTQGFMLAGRSAGVDCAKAALSQARPCGMPPARPVYFSVDFNPTFDEYKGPIKAFLQGAASVLGADQVGIYGGVFPVQWAMEDGVAAWGWQTYAWSQGQWYPGAHIQQYKNSQTIGGAAVDYDRAIKTDFGQWAATGEDLSIVDDATKAYLDDFRKDVQHGFVLVLRGDDTHTDNLDSIHADTSALRAKVDALQADLDAIAAKVEEIKAAASLEGTAIVNLAVSPAP